MYRRDTDFRKAFDSVPHARLISKIESYGITGKLLNCLKAFLGNRKQRVKVNDRLSHWTGVMSGDTKRVSIMADTLPNLR